MSDIPVKVRLAVAARSEGWCEDGCGQAADHIHHRKIRSQGGQHTLDNLLHLSHECHTWVHANPASAYQLGLLVQSWQDPAAVRVTGLAS